MGEITKGPDTVLIITEMEIPVKHFKEHILTAARYNGMNCSALARKMGVSRYWLSNTLSSDRITYSMAMRLVKASGATNPLITEDIEENV